MRVLNQISYKDLIYKNPFLGYAFHKIIEDETGTPVNYEFIEVNEQFEKFTGLRSENIIGRKVTEVIPGIENEQFNWIGFYGEIALTGKSKEIEQYSEQLNKWYKISAISPEKGFFVTLFYDITSLKDKESSLKQINEEYASLNEEYLCQNEEMQQLIQKSNDKNEDLSKTLKKLNGSKKDLLKKDILQKSILNSTANGLLAVDNNDKVLFHNDRFFDIWEIPIKFKSEKHDSVLINFVLNKLKDPD